VLNFIVDVLQIDSLYQLRQIYVTTIRCVRWHENSISSVFIR